MGRKTCFQTESVADSPDRTTIGKTDEALILKLRQTDRSLGMKDGICWNSHKEPLSEKKMILLMLEFSWKCGGDADVIMLSGRILNQTENDFRVQFLVGDDAVC